MHGALAGLLCAAVALAPMPVLAEEAAADAGASAGAPKPADGQVGLMRFGGDGNDLRVSVQQSFEGEGFTVKGVALDIQTAAGKVKCKGPKDDSVTDECLAKIGLWLNKKGKQQPPYTYLVFGTYGSLDEGQSTRVIVYDLINSKRVVDYQASPSSDDLILPLMLPRAVATGVQDYITPPAPITPEEQKVIDDLDAGLTAEEKAAQDEAVNDAREGVLSGPTGPMSMEGIQVDLKKDFDKFARDGKRTKRKSKEDPKDLRPSRKLGPFFGYWQPRAWVALGLMGAGLVATGALYGAGLARRGAYSDAVAALEGSGTTANNPDQTEDYTDLASQVASTGADYRKLLVGGDVALASSVVLFGVLAIIVYQDRTEAKAFIKQEKALAGIKNLRVGPVFAKGFQGASLGFRF